jgi:hypothetical protein
MSGADKLPDYLAGDLPPEEAEAFELALMSGAYDGSDLQWLGSVVVELRAAAISGTLTIGIAEAELTRLQGAGFVVNLQTITPQAVTDIDFGRDFDLVVLRMPMQLQPDERLDAEQVAPDGSVVRATEGLPLTEKGEFLMCCHRELVATILRGQDAIRARFTAVDPAGRKRLLYDCDLRGVNLPPA